MKQYSAILKKSGKQYLALCLELGVVGSGATSLSAKKSLQDAIESYLDYAKEENLSDERPVSVKELHEFLFYDELFKEQKHNSEEKISVKMLAYA
jgi:predicted RNase H-like HicB family nuclease